MLSVFSYGEQAQQCLYQLAGQKSPKITVNSQYGNDEEDKGQTNQETDHAVEEGKAGFAKAV